MSIHYADQTVTLHHGDCLEVLRSLPDASVDSVVTDPPYGLGFMGQKWDTYANEVGRAPAAGAKFDHVGGNHNPSNAADAARTRRVESRKFGDWCESWTAECLRVLKPGGHMLAFGGTRTWHRLACAVEDAGFEVRDSIAWLYGSGFPKSLDVSKAIDKRRDWSLVERLSGEIRRARTEAGLSLAEIGQATQDATDGTYGKWYHRGGHMFFETGRSLPSRPEWEHLRHVLPIAPEFVEVYDEAEREITGEIKGRSFDAWEENTRGYSTAPNGRSGVRKDIPATPDAERWQGWGTALKPSHEPVVVARKPLVGTAVNVLEMVESELRERLQIKEIRWTSGPASGAAKRAQRTSSSSTEAQPVAATSADHADASVMPNARQQTANGSEPNTAHGPKPTASTSGPSPANTTSDSETTCSTPMAASANAAASDSISSSPSTTSTEAAPHTGRPSTARSTRSSDVRDTHPATESFAGIATGLTGSRAHALIKRLPDGSFVWPEGLPRHVPGGSLTVAANVLAHGTGALNIDGCRIGDGEDRSSGGAQGSAPQPMSWGEATGRERPTGGRWPANVVLDESQAETLDEQSGPSQSRIGKPRGADAGDGWGMTATGAEYDDLGGASRFFYVAKADQSERPRVNGTAHPTVKPLELMRWLVRLVTPPGGTVLEPFAGSGTTVEACIVEGFHCVAIEREADYLPLIEARIARRRDPVKAITLAGEDLGLFGEATA